VTASGVEFGGDLLSVTGDGIDLSFSMIGDLTGKPKAWFVIGRSGVGKTTLLRWAAERADQNEARMVVAAADPRNRSLTRSPPRQTTLRVRLARSASRG